MSKRHAEGYRKRDVHSGIPTEEYTAGYELAFPQQDSDWMPCGHNRAWLKDGVCSVCGFPEPVQMVGLAEQIDLAVGPRIEVPAHELIPGLAHDTSPPGPPLVVTQVDQERGTVTLEAAVTATAERRATCGNCAKSADCISVGFSPSTPACARWEDASPFAGIDRMVSRG